MTKLRLKDQVLFAVGGLGENVTFQALSAWLIFFWSGRGDPSQALIPIGLLGILLGIGRFIEAFDDPLIGHLSDTTKSRLGRRFPYVFFGAPFLALSFFLLWLPVPSAIYFFLITQFFFLTYTLITAPYEGILPEIARTSKERVSTSAWRVLFGVIGAGFGLVASGLLIERFGFQMMGLILGIIALMSFWIAIIGIKKRLVSSVKTPNINLFRAIRTTLENKQFLIFSLAFVLFSLGLNLLTSLMPFYVVNLLGLSEGATSLFMALVLGGMVLALPIQHKLSTHFGKKKVYAGSMLGLGLLFPLLFLSGLTPFDPYFQTIALTTLIGFFLSGQFIYPNAILADVIDFDSIKTGARREGIYYGMQNSLQKFSFAIASLIFGITLSVFGATADDALGIRLIGPIAGFVAIIGFFVFVRWYKLPDEIQVKAR
jgi:GPH family glycoside/pentoside/hexuronide:cation symporter